jgi:hypothetical protein
MKYIIKNWCGFCGCFVHTRTIEMADCKGFQCLSCCNMTNTFRLSEDQIKKNRSIFKLIIGGKNNQELFHPNCKHDINLYDKDKNI